MQSMEKEKKEASNLPRSSQDPINDHNQAENTTNVLSTNEDYPFLENASKQFGNISIQAFSNVTLGNNAQISIGSISVAGIQISRHGNNPSQNLNKQQTKSLITPLTSQGKFANKLSFEDVALINTIDTFIQELNLRKVTSGTPISEQLAKLAGILEEHTSSKQNFTEQEKIEVNTLMKNIQIQVDEFDLIKLNEPKLI